jgi:transketolase
VSLAPAPSLDELARRSARVRLDVLDLVDVAGSGHFGPAYSCVEILVSLYHGFLRVRPEEPGWPERDRFVLSKGHACSALYPILADLGFFPRAWLEGFCRLGSPLGDHPDMKKVPGLDFSSGSLGHGLSVGAGMAEALRLQGTDARVAVLLGDGELDEGQVWEAAGYAAHRRLGSLLAIVDANKVSVDGTTDEVLALEPLDERWRAFGWRVERVDGHDLDALRAAYARFDAARAEPGARPTALVADTVAGRGISFVEGMAEWHVGYLHGEDRERAVHDILAMYGLRPEEVR